jgi:hypothetical protein
MGRADALWRKWGYESNERWAKAVFALVRAAREGVPKAA